MYSAFLQNEFPIKELSNGKIGFREEEEGTRKGIVPTETEEMIQPSFLTSFVTISFGTRMPDVDVVADSIINGLSRYKYYIDYCDLNTDLVYRSSPNDEVKVAADYFGVSVNDLITYNHLDNPNTLGGKVIINPLVGNVEAFDLHHSVLLSMENKKQL